METGIDKDTFKQIFRDHWNAFTAKNPLHYATGYHDEVVQKMLDCGDPEKMGFAQYRCTSCGETHRVAFSCKSPSASPAPRSTQTSGWTSSVVACLPVSSTAISS